MELLLKELSTNGERFIKTKSYHEVDRRSKMPTSALDPKPSLILIKNYPTYEVYWRSRMPLSTWSLSKTESYPWGGPAIKDALKHLILFKKKVLPTRWTSIKDAFEHLILIKCKVLPTGWIGNQGCPQAPDLPQKLIPTYGVDRKSRMPMSTWSLSKTKSYLQDRSTIKVAHERLILTPRGLTNNQLKSNLVLPKMEPTITKIWVDKRETDELKSFDYSSQRANKHLIF